MSSTKQLHQLPAFAFVNGGDHERTDLLEDRVLVLHLLTGTLIEMFDDTDEIHQADLSGRLYHNFKYVNSEGQMEHMCAVVLCSPTLSLSQERQVLLDEIVIPACRWYGAYCDWFDTTGAAQIVH